MGMEPNIEEHIWKLQIDRPHVSRPKLQTSIVLGGDWTIDQQSNVESPEKDEPQSDQSLFYRRASV